MRKKYMYDIVFFSIMFALGASMLFTGKLLKVSNSFLLGLATGITLGCIIVIARIIKKRKSMKNMADEREQQLLMKSMSLSHSATAVLVAVLCLITRSTAWTMQISISDLLVIILMFMVVSYFMIYAFLIRKY